MAEGGLSAAEVGKEIAEHLERSRAGERAHEARSRRITIVEAVLLATVALLAAWSGYAAARWSTESRLSLAQASTARTEASELDLEAMEARNLDAISFNAWLQAYQGGDEADIAVARSLFRPELASAFDAWIATAPFDEEAAPNSPLEMEEAYEQPEKDQAAARRADADTAYADGVDQGQTADDYVRITVLLASVLFLVGISGHFRPHGARYGLIGVSVVILGYAAVLLVAAPKP